MTDKKLTDNKIIKALECCKNDGIICFECPYKKTNGCMEKLSADALDLINRLQARVEKCEKVEHFADKTIATLQAENEKLNTFAEIKKEEIVKLITKTKAEAYKEFADELKKRSIGIRSNFDFKCDIDNLLKELVGDK